MSHGPSSAIANEPAAPTVIAPGELARGQGGSGEGAITLDVATARLDGGDPRGFDGSCHLLPLVAHLLAAVSRG